MIVIALLGPLVPLAMLLGLPALEDRLFPPPLPLPERTNPEQAEEALIDEDHWTEGCVTGPGASA
ncbi:hypothetical protein ABZ646_12760 [Streptomyces sp. NPDC007162]|uniref:hypothetical protein n=1 Tax=Streptomyces sp. NPDC007162 TaxID=3156917 RepID=UPI0033F03CD8